MSNVEKYGETINLINELKKQTDTIIVAHYYQNPEIKKVADYISDSLALVKYVYESKAKNVIFCGVKFMAETAKVVCPDKNITIPDLNAGCSLVDSCEYDDFMKFKSKYPNHQVMTYVNSSLEIKAVSDYIVTSSNALKTLEQIPESQEIIFTPDINLGKYLNFKTGRKMVLWHGECEVHVKFSEEKLKNLLILYPDAKVVAHPESEFSILKYAEFIGSTSAIINYVKNSDAKVFLIATEGGIEFTIKEANPDKTIIMLPIDEETKCACSECPYMKLNTIEKVLSCLKNGDNPIFVSKELIEKTRAKILDMIN